MERLDDIGRLCRCRLPPSCYPDWHRLDPPHQVGSEGFVPADLTIIAPPTATVNPSRRRLLQAPSRLPSGQSASARMFRSAAPRDAGLRIRSAPGLNSDTVFRGEEAETFRLRMARSRPMDIPGGILSPPTTARVQAGPPQIFWRSCLHHNYLGAVGAQDVVPL